MAGLGVTVAEKFASRPTDIQHINYQPTTDMYTRRGTPLPPQREPLI